jgi:hypothetical protein
VDVREDVVPVVAKVVTEVKYSRSRQITPSDFSDRTLYEKLLRLGIASAMDVLRADPTYLKKALRQKGVDEVSAYVRKCGVVWPKESLAHIVDRTYDYSEGFADGHKVGFTEGFQVGREEGIDIGYTNGIDKMKPFLEAEKKRADDAVKNFNNRKSVEVVKDDSLRRLHKNGRSF